MNSKKLRQRPSTLSSNNNNNNNSSSSSNNSPTNNSTSGNNIRNNNNGTNSAKEFRRRPSLISNTNVVDGRRPSLVSNGKNDKHPGINKVSSSSSPSAQPKPLSTSSPNLINQREIKASFSSLNSRPQISTTPKTPTTVSQHKSLSSLSQNSPGQKPPGSPKSSTPQTQPRRSGPSSSNPSPEKPSTGIRRSFPFPSPPIVPSHSAAQSPSPSAAAFVAPAQSASASNLSPLLRSSLSSSHQRRISGLVGVPKKSSDSPPIHSPSSVTSKSPLIRSISTVKNDENERSWTISTNDRSATTHTSASPRGLEILRRSTDKRSPLFKSLAKSNRDQKGNDLLGGEENLSLSNNQKKKNRNNNIRNSIQTNSYLYANEEGDENDVEQEYDEEDYYGTDVFTEVPELLDIDEEMQTAVLSVIEAHSNQLSKLRRLLSTADHGSSMTMHLLHGQIKSLEDKNLESLDRLEKLKKINSGLRVQLELERSRTENGLKNFTGSTVDVLSKSTDEDIRRYFRSLSTKSRLNLLHLLLESALPGDLSSLIKYLSRIEKTRRDFISQLPDSLAIRCLTYLDVPSILNCRMVSKRWDEIITRSGRDLWRSLCLSLTSLDDDPPKPKEDDRQGWFELYKGLYFREENWRLGLAQKVVVLKGHTGSIGALKLRGTTLVTGSLDGTLRIWNVRTSTCLKIVKMPAPVSSLDFFGQFGLSGVIAAGGNDVGRVFLISMNGSILSTLSGHNKGIRTLAMNSEYLVSGGYDKALVVWNWKEGTRIVKFGQQTSPCAAISLFGSSFSSVQVDGVIRCFNILTRELVSQHKVQQTNDRGSIGGEMFQWFVAEARRVIIATKSTIYQLEYNLSEKDDLSIDLISAPRLISMTPIVHELNSGTLDVLKRRFAAAPRFATRLGDNMRIFIGHLPESEQEYLKILKRNQEDDYEGRRRDVSEDGLQPIEGAWLDAESSVSSRNPTVMSLSSDQLVVGCSDGVLYGLDFCGTNYRKEKKIKKKTMMMKEGNDGDESFEGDESLGNGSFSISRDQDLKLKEEIREVS